MSVWSHQKRRQRSEFDLKFSIFFWLSGTQILHLDTTIWWVVQTNDLFWTNGPRQLVSMGLVRQLVSRPTAGPGQKYPCWILLPFRRSPLHPSLSFSWRRRRPTPPPSVRCQGPSDSSPATSTHQACRIPNPSLIFLLCETKLTNPNLRYLAICIRIWSNYSVYVYVFNYYQFRFFSKYCRPSSSLAPPPCLD
jgi:hypothetical protein